MLARGLLKCRARTPVQARNNSAISSATGAKACESATPGYCLGDAIDERRAGADAQDAGIADFDRLSEMKSQTVFGVLAFA